MSGISYGCVGKAFGDQGSYNSVHQHHNTYYTPNLTTLPFNACGSTFQQLQAAGYEVGSTISADLTVLEIMRLAKTTLGM